MLITLSSSSSSRDRIFQKLKNRMQLTVAGWSTLEDDIDESIALLEKESKRLQQSMILNHYLNETGVILEQVVLSIRYLNYDYFHIINKSLNYVK